MTRQRQCSDRRSMTKKNDKGVVSRYVVVPDLHIPLHDPKYLDVLFQAIQIVKPTGYINLGDIGEWDSVSTWQWKRKKRPPLEYQISAIETDISEVNATINLIDYYCDKAGVEEKYQIQGNHDEWIDKFVVENPYIDGIKSFEQVVDLKMRGYEYYPFIQNPSEMLKIGKLVYYHGHSFGGTSHTRMHLLKMGCNVMYGHWHDVQQYTLTHIDGPKSAWSIGCGKKMTAKENSWLRGGLVNWTHAFAIVDYFEDGSFTTHVIMVIDGRTSLWGETLRARE